MAFFRLIILFFLFSHFVDSDSTNLPINKKNWKDLNKLRQPYSSKDNIIDIFVNFDCSRCKHLLETINTLDPEQLGNYTIFIWSLDENKSKKSNLLISKNLKLKFIGPKLFFEFVPSHPPVLYRHKANQIMYHGPKSLELQSLDSRKLFD